MKKVLIAIAVLLIAVGCTTQTPYPDMTVNSLQDSSYPCLRIVFPESVKFEDMSSVAIDNESFLIYALKMHSKPAYELSVVKRRTSSVDVEWSLIPISDQYDETVKFYEISPSDIYFDRSAAVTLISKDGHLFLRGIMGEYVAPDIVYMVIADRIVKKDNYLHLFSIERWRDSSAGKRMIADMTELVDWFYNHTEVLHCNNRSRTDKMWWE